MSAHPNGQVVTDDGRHIDVTACEPGALIWLPATARTLVCPTPPAYPAPVARTSCDSVSSLAANLRRAGFTVVYDVAAGKVIA